jgi:hypothetical protein
LVPRGGCFGFLFFKFMTRDFEKWKLVFELDVRSAGLRAKLNFYTDSYVGRWRGVLVRGVLNLERTNRHIRVPFVMKKGVTITIRIKPHGPTLNYHSSLVFRNLGNRRTWRTY